MDLVDAQLVRHREKVLSLFRIVVGLLFACHGAATLFGVLGKSAASVPAFAAWPGWWAAVIQLVGGAAVALGIGTRVAALICSGSMAYAYFVAHQPKALWPIENGGVPAVLYCWAFLLIAFMGADRWALGRLLGRAR